MTKPFSYRVLKYRPSYLLDERINLGLLFSFPAEEKLIFLAPENLERVIQFYPDANLSFLKRYLDGFKAKANQLSTQNLFKNHQELVQNFIPIDANSFFFSESKNGQYTDLEDIIRYYNKLYFDVYNIQKGKKEVKDQLIEIKNY